MTLTPVATEPKELRRFTITGIEGEKQGLGSERVRSDYVEREWLPYLGPTAIVLARRVDLILQTENKSALDVAKWAELMGVAPDELVAACHRLVRYGLAVWGERDPMLSMSRWWPQVPMAIRTEPHRQALTNLPDISREQVGARP
jgi:hypothetical protein